MMIYIIQRSTSAINRVTLPHRYPKINLTRVNGVNDFVKFLHTKFEVIFLLPYLYLTFFLFLFPLSKFISG